MSIYVSFDHKTDLETYRTIKKWKHHRNDNLISISDSMTNANDTQEHSIDDMVSDSDICILLVGERAKCLPYLTITELISIKRHSKDLIVIYLNGYDHKDMTRLPDEIRGYQKVLRIPYNTPILKEAESFAILGLHGNGYLE